VYVLVHFCSLRCALLTRSEGGVHGAGDPQSQLQLLVRYRASKAIGYGKLRLEGPELLCECLELGRVVVILFVEGVDEFEGAANVAGKVFRV
jgi:hypothetical protein